MLEKFRRMLDELAEYESELRGKIEHEYEDEMLECYGEIERLIDVLTDREKLLHDIGLNPDAYYSAADRDIIRARIIGAAVPGVATV